MPESDQKPAATTRSKTQAFDLEALQLLVASTTKNVAALSKSITELKETTLATDKKVSKLMKKADINQAIQDDRQDLTTKSIAYLQTTIESQPDTIANTVRNDLRNDIDELRDKIRDGRFNHEQEVLRNDDLQIALDKLKQAPATTRANGSSSFPRFSTSYGGIRSPVPADMTADTYYQDVTPADHNIQGSYIDPATPMPTGTTGSSDLYGAPQRGLLSLVGNSQLNISKFQEKIAKLTLRDDGVTAIRDWFHGIRLALNTSGKTHIDVLPMYEMLKMSDRFSTLLLPVDEFGDIDATASSYSLCLNMYHTFGQVLLSVLTTSTTMFPVAKCPKTNRLIQVHRDLRNGWDLLWNILRKSAPHLGGKNENVHDLVSALSIFPNETLPEFYNRALNLQNTIVYSQAAVPPTRLITRFIDQLMKCPDIRPFLAHKKSAISEHLRAFGENAKYPLESLQTIFDYLEDLEVPLGLCPTGTSNGNSSQVSSTNIPDAYIARFGRDIPECDICFRRGHHVGTCVIRGPNFVPEDILRRAQQYNAKHGDKPLEPLKSWTKTAPPAARYVDKQTKFAPKAPIKPSIKYFLADSDGTPVEIDPSKISAMNMSTEPESEIFHEALEDASSNPIEPTIKQLQQNSSSIPLFPDYSSMFDPMELQQLQGN
jgi:hypothetical protein